MTAPIIEIDDIHTYYGRSYILQGLSLSVAPGETVAILGRNGVGKTTFLRSLIGFTPPRRGHIRLAGNDISGLSPDKIASRGMALVPQGRRIFRSLSVEETLSIAVRKPQRTGAPVWPLSRVYEAFPRLRERRHQRAGSLSGGEQQMLATGRALVANPLVTLLDEPTEGLSPLLVRELQSVLKTIKNEGATIILVEQRVNFAAALADRILLMAKGKIAVETGPAELRREAALRDRYLGV